jgi:hypothetical protein
VAEVAGEAVELSAPLAVEAGEGAIAAAVANPADGSVGDSCGCHEGKGCEKDVAAIDFE